jgi:hypothetical protein
MALQPIIVTGLLIDLSYRWDQAPFHDGGDRFKHLQLTIFVKISKFYFKKVKNVLKVHKIPIY